METQILEPKNSFNPSSSKEAIIEVEHLFKSFGTKHVLKDFSLQVLRGENVVVIGKSGSGKSVLIKCMVGLLYPDSGTVKVLGQNIPDLDRDALDRVRVKIGFLFQNSALYDSMTVRENLEFPMRRHWFHKEPEEVNAVIEEALTNVGLAHTIDMMPSELSGGMRKRIGLARTLILKPDIVLYDEPTTGLDPITGREIVHLIMELKKKYHTSSIVITHDMEVAHLTANKVIVLHEGKNHLEGTYDEVKKSTDPHVQQFFAKL
jgi:phospholipid/cholesterol/gamma-HCH transport system ATP-binding protein